MKKLIVVILLFIGTVSAQTYPPVNLHVVDSIKVGTSANSVWWTNLFVESVKMTHLGLDYTLDATPEFTDTLFYYLDKDGGSNANTGLSTGQAWETLVYADANVRIPATGDSVVAVLLDPRDTFQQSSSLEFTTSGKSSNTGLIYHGSHPNWSQPGDTATIQSNGATTYLILLLDVAYLTLQNLIIDANSAGIYGIFMGSFAGGGASDNAHHITIKNCDIKNTGDGTGINSNIFLRPRFNEITNILLDNNRLRGADAYGLGLYPATASAVGYVSEMINGVVISNNTIEDWHNDVAQNGSAILLRNRNNTIIMDHNTISGGNNTELGISTEHAPDEDSPATNIIIRYNDIETESHCVAILSGDLNTVDVYGNLLKSSMQTSSFRRCVHIGNGTDWDGSVFNVYNNTMVGDTYSGGFYNDATNSTIDLRNNLIYSNDGMQCIVNGGGTFTHVNNLIYRVGTTQTNQWVLEGAAYTTAGAVQGWEATAQVTDPTFTVDFTNLNLQTGSPALGNGVAIPGYTVDFDGVAVSSPPAIGAKETIED